METSPSMMVGGGFWWPSEYGIAHTRTRRDKRPSVELVHTRKEAVSTRTSDLASHWTILSSQGSVLLGHSPCEFGARHIQASTTTHLQDIFLS